MHTDATAAEQAFLSTPSVRRATGAGPAPGGRMSISIHALREEGDLAGTSTEPSTTSISIHALREEGDSLLFANFPPRLYFYPRPP